MLQTCNRKALDVYSGLIENSPVSIPDPALLMSADTVIVTNNGHILEKPRSELEHIKMLKMLRDQKSHRVFTAICAIAPREDARFPGYNIESEVVETKVIFDQNVGDDLVGSWRLSSILRILRFAIPEKANTQTDRGICQDERGC